MKRIALALALLACAAPAVAREASPSSYRLVDQNGTAFSLAQLRGQPVLVTFVASRCTDACPIVNAIFYQLQERFQRERLRARLVTITLDPDYDTPFVMAALSHRYAADSAIWRVAGGAPSAVRRLMHAFGIEAVKGRDGIPDVHTTFVYVLDARGGLWRTLLASTNLADEATQLLKHQRMAAR